MKISLTEKQAEDVRAALRDTFFAGWSTEYLASPSFREDLDAHAVRRFEECINFILPWIESYMPLKGKRVVDYGCGTGASTAAWAAKAESVFGYDIHAPSIAAAKLRMDIMGLQNVTVRHVEPRDILDRVSSDLTAGPNPGADCFVLYAVLEHQTISERIDTLKKLWRLLRPGGLLVVGDSPSRFSFLDYHTSSLPFFQWLPDELCILYADRSPREEFRRDLQACLARGNEDAVEYLARAGRAVGHQEFELALGDLTSLVVGDSFDPCMVSHLNRRVTIEDEIAAFIASSFEMRVPRGFLRPSLELILRKPASPSDVTPPQAPPPLRGLALRPLSAQPSIISEQLSTLRDNGVRLLDGPNAYIEYKLPAPTTGIEIEILKHPWSGTLVVAADGREVAAEDLFAEAAKITTLKIAFPAAAQAVRVATRANPRSQGQEAWIHAVRSA